MDDRAAPHTWDSHAARYAAQEHLEERAIATLLRLADPKPGERLVDLATGTGLVLRRLAERPERPATAVGVDASQEMLDRVGALPPGWTAKRADARATGLQGASADVVTCAYMLHLLDPGQRAAVLREARRLLDPAHDPRIVVATVHVDHDRTPLSALVHTALTRASESYPRRWGGLKPLDPTADLRAAGLEPTRRVLLNRGGWPTLVIRARPLPG